MDMPGSAVAGLVRRHRQNDTVTAVAAEDDTAGLPADASTDNV
jgi:hypothetical protein